MSLYSYVVRYDSGFAPNPFYGYCTLATCKPGIRNAAQIGDWVVGCGSAARGVNLGGRLVYSMRITEILSTAAYWQGARFTKKRPMRRGSRKQSCGDNIYYPTDDGWGQLDSFHSRPDGTPDPQHIARDTGTNRILVSTDYAYFGGDAPKFPAALRDFNGTDVCKSGIGLKKLEDPELIEHFEAWVGTLGTGLCGFPQEWMSLRDK